MLLKQALIRISHLTLRTAIQGGPVQRCRNPDLSRLGPWLLLFGGLLFLFLLASGRGWRVDTIRRRRRGSLVLRAHVVGVCVVVRMMDGGDVVGIFRADVLLDILGGVFEEMVERDGKRACWQVREIVSN